MAASPRWTNRFWVQDLIAITKLLELAAKVSDYHERPSIFVPSPPVLGQRPGGAALAPNATAPSRLEAQTSPQAPRMAQERF